LCHRSSADGRLIATRVYRDIPAEGVCATTAQYNETSRAHDVMGRQIRVKTPGGTISRTVFDGRPAQSSSVIPGWGQA
jgi:hypothetical protein